MQDGGAQAKQDGGATGARPSCKRCDGSGLPTVVVTVVTAVMLRLRRRNGTGEDDDSDNGKQNITQLHSSWGPLVEPAVQVAAGSLMELTADGPGYL